MAAKSLPLITRRQWLNAAAVAIDAYKAPTPVEVIEGDIRDINTLKTPQWWC
jgi:hypothetical protein